MSQNLNIDCLTTDAIELGRELKYNIIYFLIFLF